MRKRVLSLLLAVVLCIGLLPVGALAADGDVTVYPDGFDKDGNVVEASKDAVTPGFNREGPVFNTDTYDDVTFSGKFYIVQGDVTIHGNLTVDGNTWGGLVLCEGAMLTVTGALIHSGGSQFYIYGQSYKDNGNGARGTTGRLIIQNSKGDGAAIRSTASSAPSLNISSGKVEIYGGKSEKLINGAYLTSTSSVHKVTLDGETASPETLGSSSLNGKTLVLEYCEHPFDDYVWIKDSNTQHHWACSVCGFVSSAKDPHSVVLPVAWTETTHTLRCEYCDYTADPAKHDFTKLQSPEVSSDGKGHVSEMCEACGYTSGTAEPHHYGTDGSCDTCGFLPVFEDGAGNLYAYNGSDSIMKLNEAIEKGATYFKLVNFATGDNADTTTVNACFSLETDKSVTLDMNGHTLENGSGAPVITVEAGTLNITGAAVISQTAKSKELVAPAIKVTGGALTFDNVVTATGSAADSSAAPAILIGGGTVTFAQDVTATAVENEGLDTAIAPAIEVTGGKVIFNGKVTATGGLGGTPKNKRPCEPAIKATGGELDFNGDLDLNGGLTITGDAKLTKGLTRGTFKVAYTGETVDGYAVSVVGSSVYSNLYSLLGTGRGFADRATNEIESKAMLDSQKSWPGDVTIVEHTHSYTNKGGYHECACGRSGNHSFDKSGACSVCGKPCDHTADRANTNGHWYCDNCGTQVYAYIQNGHIFDFYTTLKDALAAAENGQTVKLVDDIDQSNKSNNDKTACLTGDNKTVTLNLNGKNITDGWIYVGIDQDGKVINSSGLNITGSGSFDGMIGISAKGTLDLSGWDGGTIKTVSSSQNGSEESTLISGENKGTITSLKFYSWPSGKITNTKLTGGTYGSIPISMNSGVTSISFSDLLAPGYAFQYADGSGSFVNYATKATYDEAGVISDVKVVKCTTHVDAKSVDADGNITDGADNLCDYCNADLTAATVATLTVGGKTYFYTDLPSALKAASSKGGTVTLQKDVENVSQMLVIEGFLHVTLDLNGKKITGNGSKSTLLGISNLSDVTICDSGTTGQIKCTASGYAVYVSEGCDLTISGGTFEGTDNATTSVPGYAVGVDGARLTITGGTFNSAVDAKDKLIVSGGTFNGAVTINARGATITGGTFNGAFSMSAQPDVFSGGTFTQQASFSNVSDILTGGEFQKGLTADRYIVKLLAVSKDYKMTGTENDWLNVDGSTYQNSTDQNVTVAEAPIHSVTLTVNGNPVALKDNKGRFSVELGTDVTLTASCEGSMAAPYVTWSPTHGGEDGGTANPVKQGTGKSLSYTLPPEDLTVGTHTYRVSFCSEDPGKVGQVTGYSEVVQITITVTKIDIANVPEDQIELELYYDGNAPYNIHGATNADGVHATTMTLSPEKPFKVNGTELNENDYTLEGNVQYGVGEYTLKINVNTDIYTGSIERTWHVIPHKLGLPQISQGDYEKTYDGGTALPKGITYFNGYFEAGGKDFFLSSTKLEPSDYTLTNEAFENATVGKDKRISLTIQLLNKNYEFNTSYIEGLAKDGITVTADAITYTNCILYDRAHFGINPATVPNFNNEVTLDIVNDLENTYTIDLPTLPALESPKTYGDITYTVASQSLEHGYATLGQPTVKQVDGKYQLCLTVPAVKYDQETSIGTILVKVTTTNYEPVTLIVNLQSVNKRQLGMFVSVATDPVVYGMTLGDIKLSAQATDGGQVIPGTIAWEDPLTTVPAAGQATYRWTFTPDDTMQYLTASNTISFSVDKATPTGAPTYTAITAGGKTLADAALTANASWPSGTVQWVDKDGKALDAATEVKANTAYQWKFTPDSKNYNPIEDSITLYSVSTGGGGSTTYPVSTPSKTENGSVSVSPKNASRGDTVTITVKPDDGYVLDDLTVTDKNGNDLKLTDKGNGKYTFTMPAGKVEVKASFAEETETSPFADVATNAYYYEAVKWAAEQGITGGIGNNLFGPNQPCTRAQIVTFLWRAAGSPEPKDMSSFADVSTDSYYAKAVAWAVENGITSGTGDGKFSPDATCTRAQAVTFLARALNAKATSAAEFSDVPTDSYFAEAVAWAASNGVTAGIGGGLFGPNNDCTRAQIVTFLFRAYNK